MILGIVKLEILSEFTRFYNGVASWRRLTAAHTTQGWNVVKNVCFYVQVAGRKKWISTEYSPSIENYHERTSH